MTLCDNGHSEVCYEVRYCPVCEKIEILKDLERDFDKLLKEIDKLKEEDNGS